MSYARYGPASAVYVYRPAEAEWLCANCPHGNVGPPFPGFLARSRRAMARHLQAHRIRGEQVEPGVIEAILERDAGAR